MRFCLARNYPARHDEFVHNHGRYEIGVVAQVFESAEAATRECDLFIVTRHWVGFQGVMARCGCS